MAQSSREASLEVRVTELQDALGMAQSSREASLEARVTELQDALNELRQKLKSQPGSTNTSDRVGAAAGVDNAHTKQEQTTHPTVIAGTPPLSPRSSPSLGGLLHKTSDRSSQKSPSPTSPHRSSGLLLRPFGSGESALPHIALQKGARQTNINGAQLQLANSGNLTSSSTPASVHPYNSARASSHTSPRRCRTPHIRCPRSETALPPCRNRG